VGGKLKWAKISNQSQANTKVKKEGREGYRMKKRGQQEASSYGKGGKKRDPGGQKEKENLQKDRLKPDTIFLRTVTVL